MRAYLIAVLLLTACAWTAQSQTKGTNAIGLGVSSQTTKHEDQSNSLLNREESNANYSLTYGYFVKDNTRIGLTATYSDGSTEMSGSDTEIKTKGFGGTLHYQKYYPLFKKFYAFAGGRGRYLFSEDTAEGGSFGEFSAKSNLYGIGAYGGAAYFLSKRFAFEVQLLSADFSYHRATNSDNNSKTTQTSLNVSSTGAINNLGFNIYFLF